MIQLFPTLTRFAVEVQQCPGGSLLGFPKWYKYLKGEITPDPGFGGNTCTPKITGINDVWLIAAAILEILLRAAVLLAIGFVVYGGIRYITSQGEPDKTKAARSTIISGIVGLVIAVTAAGL